MCVFVAGLVFQVVRKGEWCPCASARSRSSLSWSWKVRGSFSFLCLLVVGEVFQVVVEGEWCSLCVTRVVGEVFQVVRSRSSSSSSWKVRGFVLFRVRVGQSLARSSRSSGKVSGVHCALHASSARSSRSSWKVSGVHVRRRDSQLIKLVVEGEGVRFVSCACWSFWLGLPGRQGR